MAKQKESKEPSKATSAQPDDTSAVTTKSYRGWQEGVGPKPIREGVSARRNTARKMTSTVSIGNPPLEEAAVHREDVPVDAPGYFVIHGKETCSKDTDSTGLLDQLNLFPRDDLSTPNTAAPSETEHG